ALAHAIPGDCESGRVRHADDVDAVPGPDHLYRDEPDVLHGGGGAFAVRVPQAAGLAQAGRGELRLPGDSAELRAGGDLHDAVWVYQSAQGIVRGRADGGGGRAGLSVAAAAGIKRVCQTPRGRRVTKTFSWI